MCCGHGKRAREPAEPGPRTLQRHANGAGGAGAEDSISKEKLKHRPVQGLPEAQT